VFAPLTYASQTKPAPGYVCGLHTATIVVVAPVTVAVAVIVCPTVIAEPPILAVAPDNIGAGVPEMSPYAGWLNCGTPLVLIELTHWCDIALTASTPPNVLVVGLGN